KTWTFTSDGDKTLSCIFIDGIGNKSSSVSDNIVVDITPPYNNSISITEGDTVASLNINFTVTSLDTQTCVDSMVLSDGTTTDTRDYEIGAKTWTFSSDGVKTLSCVFIDGIGNKSSSVSATTIVDITSPYGSITIHYGATYTNTNPITLTLSASDTQSGVGYMTISNTITFAESQTFAYATSNSWTLSTNDGEKTVYVKFTDNIGNVSDIYSDTIIMDLTPPTSGEISALSNWTEINTVSLTWTSSSDITSGLQKYGVMRATSLGGSYTEIWTSTDTTTSYNDTNVLDGTTYYYKVKTYDKANNTSLSSANSTTIDVSAPNTPTLLLPEDNAKLNDATPLFSWTLTDTGSPVKYCLEISETSTFSPLTFVNTFTLSSYTLLDTETLLTNKTYYWRVRASDLFRTGPSALARNLLIDTQVPIINITSPSNGAITTSCTQTLKGNIIESAPLNTAILVINGTQKIIDVAAGAFSESIGLNKGLNNIQVKSYDQFSNLGSSIVVNVEYVDAISPNIPTNIETTVISTGTIINIPQGTFNETAVISIADNPSNDTITNANNKAVTNPNLKLAGELANTIKEFKAFKVIAGQVSCTEVITDNFNKNVVITISYPAGLDSKFESSLRIHFLNEAAQKWEIVPGTQTVDKNNRTVSASVNHFSLYRLFGTLVAASDLSNVIVFPNPYKPKDAVRGTLKFNNLTSQATIKIYTIAGELVVTLEENDGDGTYEWNGKNESGEEIVSGIYIYRVTNNQADKPAVGKIAIIR
ncbi:hypothetical protein COY51_07195, partial [Candidatus Desantisbacteria bacterium CG_4_10_14_0_8_um_filter_39_17]